MITVIAGTNRKGSRSRQIAKQYHDILLQHTEEECKLLSLEDIQGDFMHVEMYDKTKQHEGLARIQDEYFTPAHKLVFVVPEYNGSFPGVFKLFIDAISVRNYDANFRDKKVALVGVASGRAGNLRGLDHLTTSLNYLKMNVFYNRLPIARVEDLVNDSGEITEEALLAEIQLHIAGFLTF